MADYQVMPPLSEEEYQELKSDIAARGVMVPIEFDEDGNVLDGHHRLRACEELGIKEYPRVVRAGMSESEKRMHARKLNILRRQLSQEQINKAIREQSEETPDRSSRSIARDLGVSTGRVERNRTGNSQVRKSSDGRVFNRRVPQEESKENLSVESVTMRQISVEGNRPVSVFNPTPRESRALRDERVVERMKETGSKSPVNTEHKIRAEEKAERKSYELAEEIPEGAMKLFVGDIRTGLPEIEDDSIDFIVTDPPYPKEYLPLYQDLALLSQRVLKPGGSLIVMSGQSYLPEIYTVLSAALDYYWTCAYMTPGAGAPHLWQKQVSTFWKPLLWFTKGVYQGEFIGDVFTSPVDELDKSYHEWGQTVGGMKDIVEKFTNPGDMILDPYLGGGATGVAAVLQGRKFIGVDIDEDCVRRSKERIEIEYQKI